VFSGNTLTGLRLTAGTIAILVGAGAAMLLAATTGTPISARTPCISDICVEVAASPVEVPWDSSTQITVTATNVGSKPVEFQLVGHCPVALEITTIDDQPVLWRFPFECIDVPDRLILAPQEAKTATFGWSPRNALPVPPDHPIRYRAWGLLDRRQSVTDGRTTWHDAARSTPVILTVVGEQSDKERYMAVLREDLGPEEVKSVVAGLERDYSPSRLSVFTEGTQAGVLLEVRSDQVSRLSAEHSVTALHKVADQGTASQTIPPDGLYKLPSGWAIPGSYVVHLFGAELGFEADITRRLPAWKDPQGAKARESRLIAAVDGVAQDLVQEYGGRFVSTSAPSGASFSCAMNEAQARGMASDPRVRYVSESGWIELN
jgi:hypothetical protein